MSMQSSLGRARGLGSSRVGTDHWYAERMTALAMIPLTLWFVVSLLFGVAADYASLQAWLGIAGNMTLLILLIVNFFWHGQLAGTTVVEDYVHGHGAKLACLTIIRFGAIFFGVFCIVAVLKIGLGG